MVWSSARPENVGLMCNFLFSPQQRASLVAEWGRDTLGLNPAQYNEKVQVYKRLGWVWANEEVQRLSCPGYVEGHRWGQGNTILVDDGLEKGRTEPWNLVEVPAFEGTKGVGKGGKGKKGKGKKEPQMESDHLAEVVAWIEEARWWSDVSGFSQAMGRRFEVGKEWACVEIDGNAKKQDLRSLAESEKEDSDSDGGVRLPP